jgi:anti-sigma factor NepR-like protein
MCERKSKDVALEGRAITLNGDHQRSARERNEFHLDAAPESTRALAPWFNKQLSRLYAEMLKEPLPEEMLNLLKQLRRNKKSTLQ